MNKPEKHMGNELHYIVTEEEITTFSIMYDMDLGEVLKQLLNRMN